MKLPRVIPLLLIEGNRLIKTKNFSSAKYVGDPLNVIKIFNEKEVDEIAILDISKNIKEPNYNLLKNMAEECFVPLSYGGNIRNLETASKIFKLGFEKVILNSGFLESPHTVRSISEKFGSQSVIVSIDIKKNWRNKMKVFSHKKNKILSSITINDLFQEAISCGAGEILLQLVHLEGTGNGNEEIPLKKFIPKCSLPIIISGGCSSLEHISKYLSNGADAVACGSFFCFYGPHKAVLITYPNKTELEKLK